MLRQGFKYAVLLLGGTPTAQLYVVSEEKCAAAL